MYKNIPKNKKMRFIFLYIIYGMRRGKKKTKEIKNILNNDDS